MRNRSEKDWAATLRDRADLHLVLAKLLVGEALEPLLEAAEVHGLLAGFHAAGVLDDRLLDEDRDAAAILAQGLLDLPVG